MTETDIIRYLNDQAGREEVAKIEAWIAESKENAITFHRWKSVWESAGAITPSSAPDVDQAWDKVLPKLKRPVVPLYRQMRRIAAAIILLMGLSYFGWNYFGASPALIELVGSAESVQEIELPDGSKVWLNGETKIAYPEHFSKTNRTIQLEGEAYFEVVRNENAPFIIEGQSSSVQVLGTSFVLLTHPDSVLAQVKVKSGKVALYPKDLEIKDGIILRLGERGTLNLENGTLQKDTIPDKNYLAWQNKVLEFNDTTVKAFVETLEKVYKTKITVENKALFTCTITGKYENLSLEEILEAFSFLFEAEVVKEGKAFLIKAGNGC